VKTLELSWNKRCTHYRRLPEDGLLSQAETISRTNQHINNTVQQVGIDSLWTKNKVRRAVRQLLRHRCYAGCINFGRYSHSYAHSNACFCIAKPTCINSHDSMSLQISLCSTAVITCTSYCNTKELRNLLYGVT